jgi:hypothetical protein
MRLAVRKHHLESRDSYKSKLLMTAKTSSEFRITFSSDELIVFVIYLADMLDIYWRNINYYKLLQTHSITLSNSLIIF